MQCGCAIELAAVVGLKTGTLQTTYYCVVEDVSQGELEERLAG